MSDTVVTIIEQRTTVTVEPDAVNVATIGTDDVQVVTIAEQGPAGASLGFQITVSDTPPTNPSVGDVWIQTESE